MSNKASLFAVVIAALAVLFFLFGGTELFTGSGDGAGDAPDGGTDPTALTTDDAAGQDPDAQPARGPVLFGRSRAELVGKGSLAGRVLDFETSEPIAQANVVLAGTGYGDEKTAVQASTNEHGFFRFDEVAAGDGYGLHVTDAKRRERTLSSLVIDADQERDIGVVWMGKASALEGTVLDAAGLPVASADVSVHEGGGSLMELLRNMSKMLQVLDRDAVPHARVRSKRTGRFVFDQLAPGPYTLVVRADGFQMATRKVVMTSKGAAGGKVTLRLAAGSAIVGVVVDDRDRPIEGARVACMGKNDMESVFFGRQYSETDAEGRFRIDTPPSTAAVTVIVRAEGYPTLFTEATPGGEELRFVLVGGVRVLLRVLEKGTERAIEGASVMAMFAEQLTPGGGKMTFAQGVTDHRGEVEVLAPPSKLQMLFLSHAERGNGMYNPMIGTMGIASVVQGPKDTTIKAPRTELVFTMTTGVTIQGTVKDPDGKPLAGVRLSSIGMMGAAGSTTSAADGTYALENQSPPVLMLAASAPGYVQVPAQIAGMSFGAKPQPGGIVEHDVTMRPAASIAGRVVDESGRPLPGVEVKTGGGAGMLAAVTGGSKQTITNAAGGYVIDGVLPMGKSHVLGRLAGYLDTKTEDFDMTSGVVQAPDIVMPRGSRILVKVERPDGTAVKEARVEVNVAPAKRVIWDMMDGMRGFADVVTNAAGKAEIEDLPDGTITLTASKKGFSAARWIVRTKREEKDKYEVVIRLRAAVTLKGRVLNDDGPVKGAVVQTLHREVTRENPMAPYVPRLSATTGADGRFEIEGLPEGVLRVAATAAGHKPYTQEVEAGGGAIEIRLETVDAEAQKRIEAIDAELAEIMQQFATVKDEAERNALAQRMLQLRQEKAKLQKTGDGK